MFGVLLWKEIRNHLMTFRFGAALITTFVLIMLSMWVLGEDYIRRRNAHNLAAETSARYATEEVHVPSGISPTLYRPPSALSIFSQGEERRFGNSVQVRRWEVPRQASGNFGSNLMMVAQPPFDLFTIVAVVLSLFGIILTYDAISGEREKGILKVQLSCGGSRATLFAAKFIGGVVCLAIPFVFSMAAGFILLSFVIGVGFTPLEWAAIAAMIGAALVYGAVFIALGLACSAAVRRSSVALVLSLFLWTILVIVLPSTAQSAADTLVPLPSPSQIGNLEKATEAEAMQMEREIRERYPRAGYGYWTGGFSIGGEGLYFIYDTWPEAFRDAEGFIRELEPYMLSRADRVWNAFREYESVKIRQAELEQALAFAAPIHHLRNAFNSLAGTNFSNYEDFMGAVRRYRRELIENFRRKGYFTSNVLQFFSRIDPEDIDMERFRQRVEYYNSQLASGKRYDEFMGPSYWGPLPADETPPVAHSVEKTDFESALWPIAFLVVATAVLVSAGFGAFLRYDVR